MSEAFIAPLGLEIDSRPATQAAADLDRMTASAERTERATNTLGAATARNAAGTTAYARAMNDNATAAVEMARRASALQSQLDPLHASRERLNRVTGEASALARAGAISYAEEARLVGLATRSHTELQARVAASSRTAALSANDWRMLGFQLNDAATMALSGASAFQIVATQGGQVFQVLQGANGGIRGILAGVATAGGAATIGVTALVAALAAGAAAYNSFDNAEKRTQRNLVGSGRVAAMTPGDVRDMAERSPLAYDTAADFAGRLAATGRADRAGIGRALAMTRDLSATMGTSTDEATNTLVGLAQNGVPALDKLNERYRFLSTSQRQYILELEQSGRPTEAFRAGLDALSRGLGRYGDLASTSTKFTDRLAVNWGDFTASVKSGVAAMFGDERTEPGLRGLKDRQASLANEASALQKQLADLDNGRKRMFGSPVDDAALDGLYPVDRIRIRLDEIARLQEDTGRRIATARQGEVMAQRQAANELDRMRAERITSVVSTLQRENDMARRNPVEQRVAQAERDAGVFRETDLATRLQETARMYDPYRSPQDVRGDRASDTRVVTPPGLLTAPPPAMSRSAFEQRFTDERTEQQAGIRRQVEEGHRISQASRLDEIKRSMTMQTEAETQALGRSAGAAETLRQKAALRVSLGQQGVSIEESIARRIEEQAAAYGRATQLLAERTLMRDMEFQRSQLDRTPGEAAIAAQLRPVYGDDLSGHGAQVAAEYIRATQAIQDTQRAQAALGSMASSLIDPMLDSTRSWSKAFDDLSKNIARAALQAALFGQGPLTGLFGTQAAGQGLGGLAGSLVSAGASAFTGGVGIGGAGTGFDGLPTTGGAWLAEGYVPGYATGRIPGFADGATAVLNRPGHPAITAAGPAARLSPAGILDGPGTSTSDSILARVSRDEAIIRASSVQHYGADVIRAINERTLDRSALPGFASGYAPPTAPMPPSPWRQAPAASSSNGAVSLQIVNNGTPQQVDNVQETRDDRGNRTLIAQTSDMVAAAISQPGGAAQRAVRRAAAPQVARR